MADAITVTSDMKVYEPEFNAGFYEALYQNTNIFNCASRNGITLITQVHQGHYLKEAYFKQISSLVTRQDITSVSAVDSKKLEQVEEAAVKLHSKIGPVQFSKKSFKMAGLNIESRAGSFYLGRLVADAVASRIASQAIMAVNAAVGGQSDLIYDVTDEGTPTATLKYLNRTRGKWGDQLNKLASWLMHSSVFLDVWDQSVDIPLESVAGVAVAQGAVPGLLGGGLVVTDNANLYSSGDYYTIGLAAGACVVRQSELQEVVIQTHTGYEQILMEVQGEFAVSIGIDGFTWDITNGGSNPTDANLATTTNWDKVRTDTTGLPLVRLTSLIGS